MPGHRPLLVLFASAVVLAGCGGSKSGSSGPKGFTPRITIAWPARSRDLQAPNSALSAQFTFTGAGKKQADVVFGIDRPNASGVTTESFPFAKPIVPGTYPMTIRYFAEPGETGAVVGTSSIVIRIATNGTLGREDGSPLGTVGYLGTISTVTINPNQRIDVGMKADLIVSAFDADSHLIPVSPGSIHLTVQRQDLLSLNLDGTVTGLADGTVPVTAEIDSKFSPATDVIVAQPSFTPRSLSLMTGTLRYDAHHNKIWAILPKDTPNGNSIVDIDPATLNIGNPIVLGNDPGAMAITDDGSKMFVGLNGNVSVVPVDLETHLPGSSFSALLPTSPSGAVPIGIAVQPGSDSVVSVITGLVTPFRDPDVAIYDNGARRTKTSFGRLACWTSSNRIVSYTDNASVGYLIPAKVTLQGCVSPTLVQASQRNWNQMIVSGGRIYSSEGAIFDASTLDLVGRLGETLTRGVTSYGIAVNSSLGRVYLLNSNSLSIYRTDNLQNIRRLKVNSLDYSGDTAHPGELLTLYGTNGMVIRTPTKLYFIDDLAALENL